MTSSQGYLREWDCLPMTVSSIAPLTATLTICPQRRPHKTWPIWASKWQMAFKTEKCYVMFITNKIHFSKLQHCLKGFPLQPVSYWPYLGVEIDNKLTWTPHLDKVSKAAARTLGIVQCMLHAAPQACRNMAYQTLVRPNWSTPPLPGAPKLKVRSVSWSPSRTRQPALWHTNTTAPRV